MLMLHQRGGEEEKKMEGKKTNKYRVDKREKFEKRKKHMERNSVSYGVHDLIQ